MKEPKIVSIIGGGRIGRELNLEALGNELEGEIVSYDPNNWHGLRLRFKETDPSVLVFRSGKYNVAGATSTQELFRSKEKFLQKLDGLGIDTSKENDIEYEPEQFPGLLYRPPDSNGTFLIFNTGKVILTGIREEKGVKQKFIELDNQLIL